MRSDFYLRLPSALDPLSAYVAPEGNHIEEEGLTTDEQGE